MTASAPELPLEIRRMVHARTSPFTAPVAIMLQRGIPAEAIERWMVSQMEPALAEARRVFTPPMIKLLEAEIRAAIAGIVRPASAQKH